MAVDAPGIPPTSVRQLAFVSQKGLAKTAKQLRDLLSKPGREELLRMYAKDVAEFSVLVGVDTSGEVGLDPKHVSGLSLTS